MKSGWQLRRLGDLDISCFKGVAPKEKISDGDTILIPSGAVFPGGIKYERTKRFASSTERVAGKILSDGDILLNCGGVGTLGRSAVFRCESMHGKAVPDSFVLAIRSKSTDILGGFLFHYLQTVQASEWIIANTRGTTGITSIRTEAIMELKIPIPSLSEQNRIITLLDKMLADLVTAKANVEQNLQNVATLFERQLSSAIRVQDDEWKDTKLEDICVIGDGNHSSKYPRREELVEDGVPFIRATNLVSGKISGEDMRFLSPDKHEQLKKGHLKTGDILFTNRGEIGKTAIVDAAYNGANLNSQIAWLRCGQLLNNRFLFYVLNSEMIKSYLESTKSGTALQQFTIRQIKELRIPVPGKDCQDALADCLDLLSLETQRLTRLYERKLAALEELKKSLLHKAFNGEL